MRVLVTGASGFIGQALAPALRARGYDVRGAYRTAQAGAGHVVGDVGPATDWSAALDGVQAVVHLAAPAHAMHDAQTHAAVTVGGTAALLRQAERAGVTRFVQMSSIKAVADSAPSAPLTEHTLPHPRSLYGRAKLEADCAVLAARAMRPVVLRPPLVHGPHARANLAALLALAQTPLPLPFAALRNRRSVIALGTLIAAVSAVLAKADGATGAFLIADRPALSTAEIVAALRAGLARPPGLFAVAPALLRFAPAALVESLEADDSRFREAYGYGAAGDADPRLALAETARGWKEARHARAQIAVSGH